MATKNFTDGCISQVLGTCNKFWCFISAPIKPNVHTQQQSGREINSVPKDPCRYNFILLVEIPGVKNLQINKGVIIKNNVYLCLQRLKTEILQRQPTYYGII